MKTKTLLLVAAFVVAGMIPARAQSNPGSTNGTDAEMELAWPDGQAYSTSLQSLWNYIALKSAVNGKINLHDDYSWSETGGGSGSAIDQVDVHPYWTLQDDDFSWPGGRWPEFGVGVDTYIPNGGTNVSYPPSAGYDRFYFGSQSFQSSDGNLTIQNQDQAEFVMLTGGAPGATGNELYEISGSAYTMFYTDKSLPSMNAIVVPPTQIQIGNLGSLDTNGVLYASLPVHSSVPVTPHVNSSGYHGGHFYTTAYKLASECEASVPTNYARTTIGVGEIVSCYMNPSISAKWSVSGGGSVSPASPSYSPSTIFTAPSSRASVTVTATFPNGSQLSKQFTVIEPTGYVRAQIVSTDTASYFGTGNAGAGMTNTIWIGPTTVSFGKVSIMEVGEVSTDATGYFANTNTWPASKLDHSQHGANHWVALGDPNTFSDHASSGTCPTPWSSGSFSWTIPADWKVGGGPTNSMTGWNQLHTIDSSGKVTVQKFGHTVTRTPNDVITTQ